MFDENNIIEKYRESINEKSKSQKIKSLDSWLRGLISVCSFTVAFYTAMHGINATLHFRAQGTLGTVTGIAGIIVLEVVFLVLTHGLIHGTFRGGFVHVSLMTLAAFLSLSFILLNTVIDSQLNSQTDLSSNLAFYFHFVMPVSSVVVVVIALVGMYFSPESEQQRRRAKQEYDYNESVFTSHMALKAADLAMAETLSNAQIASKTNAAIAIAAEISSEDVQAKIKESARGSIPALLRAIGVNPEHIPDVNSNGGLDLDDVAAYLESNPDMAARLFGQARRNEPVVTFPAETRPAPVTITPRPDIQTGRVSVSGISQQTGGEPLTEAEALQINEALVRHIENRSSNSNGSNFPLR